MNATFSANTITVNGQTFPAQYSISPDTTVYITVTVEEDGQPVSLRIKIDPADPNHAAALAAAQPANPETLPDDEPDAPAQQTQPEPTPHDDPDASACETKTAAAPVPEKFFIGMEIKGNGWKIFFDSGYDRTRVIFKRKPCDAARAAVKDAGFFWSPAMQSWNKKLTFKAWRAAQSLALELKTICG